MKIFEPKQLFRINDGTIFQYPPRLVYIYWLKNKLKFLIMARKVYFPKLQS